MVESGDRFRLGIGICYDGRFVTSICFGAFHGDLYRPVEKEAGDDYGR